MERKIVYSENEDTHIFINFEENSYGLIINNGDETPLEDLLYYLDSKMPSIEFLEQYCLCVK